MVYTDSQYYQLAQKDLQGKTVESLLQGNTIILLIRRRKWTCIEHPPTSPGINIAKEKETCPS